MLIVCLGLGFALHSIRIGPYTWPDLSRLDSATRSQIRGLAVGSSRLLRLFQLLYVSVWTLVGGLVLAGLLITLACLLQAALPGMALTPSRPVDSIRVVLALVTGQPASSRTLTWLVRGGWILYCSLVLAAPILSMGHLAAMRRATRRRLRRAAATTAADPRHEETLQILDTCRSRAGVPRISLAITPDARAEVRSHLVGLAHPEPYIEISEWLLAHLRPDEKEALLCHELAHHLSRDCLLDNLCRWLGRLTLTGDGFARALQDSLGHEQRADEIAVLRLGASPTALARSLRKVRGVQWLLRGAGQPERSANRLQARLDRHLQGLLADLDLRNGLIAARDGLSVLNRWRVSWYLFLRQHLFGMKHHYWHPDLDDRLTRLEQLQRQTQTAPPGPETE